MDEVDTMILDILRGSDPLTPAEVKERIDSKGKIMSRQRVQHRLESLFRFKFVKKESFDRVLGGKMHHGFVYSIEVE